MKTTVRTETEINVKTLHVEAGVRCWGAATVNGVDDEAGELIPFRDGDTWKPVIDLDESRIIDWPQGVTARIHYKVCDNGRYELRDDKGASIASLDGYVPSILCPKENGYGDYIIMDVNADGVIAGFNANDIYHFFAE